MGLRFDLPSSPIVAYLISGSGTPPRVSSGELVEFLRNMSTDRRRFVSPSDHWRSEVRRAARECMDRVPAASGSPEEPLAGYELARSLAPLAVMLRNYAVLVLPIGSRRDERHLDRFADEAARVPGHGILTLIPTLYQPRVNTQVLDPDEGVREALRRRDEWPGAVFVVRDGRSIFLPLDEAYGAVAELSRSGTDRLFDFDAERIWSLLEAWQGHGKQSVRRRLLHLSDLHLGTRETGHAQQYVQGVLRREAESADHIVITGDLFDQPRARHREEYDRFVDQLTNRAGMRPIVVPGNHDQRHFGNRFLLLGRRTSSLADLDWSRGLHHDPATGMAFFCFDSSRIGNAARGGVSREQLLKVATRFETENLDAALEGHLRIALVHHHPYPYPSAREVQVVSPRTWPVRERLLEMKDAERFRSWCAGRGIELVLHGHRHIPRLVVDHVGDGPDEHPRQLTTVGCGTSLGAHGAPMSFNVVEWHPVTRTWTVDFRIDRGDGQGFRSAAIQAAPPLPSPEGGGRVRRTAR